MTPYKAQNMSNNARAVATPDADWGEIGVSQYVQAQAADVTPTTVRCFPIVHLDTVGTWR